MATLREFRQNVQDVYAKQLKIEFVPGMLEGPLELTEPVGSCYLQRVTEIPGRVAEVQITVVIRVFLPFTQRGRTAPKVPYDTGLLEDLGERVFAVAAANQTGLGVWFQRLTQLSIDPRTQMVEAILVASDGNPQEYPRVLA